MLVQWLTEICLFRILEIFLGTDTLEFSLPNWQVVVMWLVNVDQQCPPYTGQCGSPSDRWGTP